MKSYMFAIALCIGTAAAAQSSGSGQAGNSGTTMSTTGQGSTGQGSTQSGSNWGRAGNSEAAGTPVGQTNANPMGARSDTGNMGTDANGMQNGTGTTGTGMGTANAGAYNGMGGPAMAGADYPPCSRNVRDHCTQTNERGMRRRPRR